MGAPGHKSYVLTTETSTLLSDLVLLAWLQQAGLQERIRFEVLLRAGIAEMTRPEAIRLPLALFLWRANAPWPWRPS